MDKLVECYLFQNLQHWNPKATGFCFLGDKSSDSGILTGLPIHSTPNLHQFSIPYCTDYQFCRKLNFQTKTVNSFVVIETHMGNAKDPLPSSEWLDPLDLSEASMSSSSSSVFCNIPILINNLKMVNSQVLWSWKILRNITCVTSQETSLVSWHEVLLFWSCSVPLFSGDLFFSVSPTPWSPPYISCS